MNKIEFCHAMGYGPQAPAPIQPITEGTRCLVRVPVDEYGNAVGSPEVLYLPERPDEFQ